MWQVKLFSECRNEDEKRQDAGFWHRIMKLEVLCGQCSAAGRMLLLIAISRLMYVLLEPVSAHSRTGHIMHCLILDAVCVQSQYRGCHGDKHAVLEQVAQYANVYTHSPLDNQHESKHAHLPVVSVDQCSKKARLQGFKNDRLKIC